MKEKEVFKIEDLKKSFILNDNKYNTIYKGRSFINNSGDEFIVLGKIASPLFPNSSTIYAVKFLKDFPEDSCIIVASYNIDKGNFRNPFKRSILNNIISLGNHKNYNLGKYGKKKRKYLYDMYRDLVRRIITPNGKNEVDCYLEVSLDERWNTYEKFLDWVFGDPDNNFHWFYQIDKDLLDQRSKVYGPDTCIFLPQQLNKALSIGKNINTSIAQGVHKMNKSRETSNPYRSAILISFLNIRHQFRSTMSESESFLKYAAAKHYILKVYADIYYKEKYINLKVKNAIYKYDIYDTRNIINPITLQMLNYITDGLYNKEFNNYCDLYDYYLTHNEEMIEFTEKIQNAINSINIKEIFKPKEFDKIENDN